MTTQGKRLKNIRIALNFTQEQLGQKLGISKQFYSNIETDRTLLNNEKLELLYKDYNVNLNYLIGGNGSMFIEAKTKPTKDIILKRITKVLEEEGILN